MDNNDNIENKNIKKEEQRSFINLKYLKDNSYPLFNEIFNNIEIKNINGEKVKLNNYRDFNKFQIKLNSEYKSIIKEFDYKKNQNISIIKENPYRSIKLRKISKDEGAITISTNGIFARTSKIESHNQSSFSHYITIIGNALIVKGIYFYEVKILDLGEDSDLCIGIISKECPIFNKNIFKNFPIVQFKDGYGINLNIHYELKNSNKKYLIKNGDVILVKINLKKNYIYFYINGKNFKNNKITIKNSNTGYYPAFSLSNEKEIQVNFGGGYDLEYYSDKGTQLEEKPLCKYNNLEKIIKCYMFIIQKNLIKIINHSQISYNDSLRFFFPMINFFGNIAFKDEYIVKNYILKFMYENIDNIFFDIYKYFNSRYNFIYVILQTLDSEEKKKSVIFLLDCLCEEINYYSNYNIEKEFDFNKLNILIKLYNYFLQKKLFQEILFDKQKENNNKNIEKFKAQLFSIFRPLKIFGIYYDYINKPNISKNFINKKINNFIISSYNNKISFKLIIESYSELIYTLLNPNLEYPSYNFDKSEEKYLNDFYEENNIKKEDSNKDYQILKILLLKKIYNSSEKKDKNIKINRELSKKIDLIEKKWMMQKSYYRIIFFDLINDIYNSKSQILKFNFISTIFFPLLNLFNKTYEKEENLTLINKQIISFLPIIGEKNNILIHNPSSILIQKRNINNEGLLEKLINSKNVLFELYEKKYNITTYLFKIIIDIFSFFNQDLELYEEIQNKIKKISDININNKENIDLNNYFTKFQNFVFLYNKEHYNIINKTINILIPYFNISFTNNFYLFFPFNVINGIKFFVEFFFYNSFINQNFDFLLEENGKDLINIYLNFNFKLLEIEIINKKFLDDSIININKIFSLFGEKKKFEDKNEDNEEKEKEKLNEKNKTSIQSFFKEEHFRIIFNSIQNYYNICEKNIKKIFEEFILYSSSEVYSENSNYFFSNLIKYISIDSNNFWFNDFIINLCVKRKIINKIIKISNLLNNINDEFISDHNLKKLEKYLQALFISLSFVSDIFDEIEILKKYFNNLIKKSDLNDLDEEEIKINIEEKEEDNYPIYSYFIKSISLITKKLFCESFFSLFKKQCIINSQDIVFFLYNIILKGILFLKNIIISIPNDYKDIIENKKKDNKKNEKCSKKIENKDIKQYYINIVNNIKKSNIGKIICLIQKYEKTIDIDLESTKTTLKKIISVLDDIKIKANINIIDSEEEKEITMTCPICLDNFSDCHVSPCGHTFCWTCIQKFNDKRCPICRKNMNGVLEYPNFKFPQNNNFLQVNNSNNPFSIQNNHSNQNINPFLRINAYNNLNERAVYRYFGNHPELHHVDLSQLINAIYRFRANNNLDE